MLKLLLIIFISLIKEFITQSTNIKLIELRKTYNGTNSDNEITYFKLIIDSNSENSDLLILVRASDDLREFSDPDIFISKVFRFNIMKENSLSFKNRK